MPFLSLYPTFFFAEPQRRATTDAAQKKDCIQAKSSGSKSIMVGVKREKAELQLVGLESWP